MGPNGKKKKVKEVCYHSRWKAFGQEPHPSRTPPAYTQIRMHAKKARE